MDRSLTYVAIEGPIGVGKTTLAKALGTALNARVILEEAEDNPFLPFFYKDTKRYALPTQLAFLVSRYKQQREIYQRDLFHQTTVADYLFEKDRIFATIALSPDELRLYNRIADLLDSALPKPSIVLLLQASANALIARVRSRGRGFEAPMELEYLQKVCETYNRHFFDYTDAPLLIVNTDEVNVAADPNELQELLRQMTLLEHGTQYYVPVSRKGA